MFVLLFSISQKIGDAKFEVQRKHHKCSSYQRHIPENKLNQIKIVLLLFRNIEKILVKKNKQTNVYKSCILVPLTPQKVLQI